MAKKPSPSRRPGKRAMQSALKKSSSKTETLPRHGRPVEIDVGGKKIQSEPRSSSPSLDSVSAAAGKRSNRRIPTGAELDLKGTTVAKMKSEGDAERKRAAKLQSAATPKDAPAPTPEQKRAAKIAAKDATVSAMKKRIAKMEDFHSTTYQQLAAYATDYFETSARIEEAKPIVSGLKGLVQIDKEELMKLSKEAESKDVDRDEIAKRLGSVGRDLRRRSQELAEKTERLQALKDQRKADVQEVMTIVRDKLLGGNLFESDSAAAGAEAAKTTVEKTPTPEKEATERKIELPSPSIPALEIGSTYVYAVERGPARGKSATVRVTSMKGADVTVEIVADATGALPAGSVSTFDASSGSWTRADPLEKLADDAIAEASKRGTPAPSATKVAAPDPSWFRRPIDHALDDLVRPAAIHALKMAGLNTLGDIVKRERDLDAEDYGLADLFGITTGDARTISSVISEIVQTYNVKAAELRWEKVPALDLAR